MTKLTIFSAPKAFTDPNIARIQLNAIASWKQMGSDVEVILIGEEEGLKQAANDLGVIHLPDVRRNRLGTPLVSSIFELARAHNQSPLLMYVNADILLFPEFLSQSEQLTAQKDRFLLVGQRWDLQVDHLLEYSLGWDQKLRKECFANGQLHPRGGSDYFLFPRACFSAVPDFAIGRAGWDNWMIYHARRSNWSVVDGSRTVQIIHQNHDYGHLPNGQPHYRLPESQENVTLAGGLRTIFTLEDCEYTYEKGILRKINKQGKSFWREVEIFPLVKLHAEPLALLFYGLFHPHKAFAEIKTWLVANRSASGRSE
jgi:hypothetical protein